MAAAPGLGPGIRKDVGVRVPSPAPLDPRLTGDPAYDALPAYFTGRLGPTLQALLDAAAKSGQIRSDIDAEDLLIAVSRLCTPGPGGGLDQSHRMVALLMDGLRYGATTGH